MTMNERVLAAIHAMPQQGGYNWPSNDSSGGCLKDLKLGGSTILKAGKGTYCCGITLEAFWRAHEALAKESGRPFMGGITLPKARGLQRSWFCIGTRKGAQDAMVALGLGTAVATGEAKPGDFVQFWRGTGSGHSAIVLSIAQGRIAYLSTQRSTNGIGSRVEPLPAECYVVRAIG